MTFGVSSSVGWLAEKLTKRTISDQELSSLLDEFKFDLAENDVSWELAEQLAVRMREELAARKVERFGADVRQLLVNTFKTYLTEALPAQEVELLDLAKIKSEETFVLMFIGANGSGKSTTLAKFAHRYKTSSYKPMMVCADTFRAGAIEQLGFHASKLGIDYFHGEQGADPAAVAYDAVEKAKRGGFDVVLIDTAGRLQTDVDLMDELSKVKRVVQPSHILLVVDALIGNDSWEQAKVFGEAVGFDSAVVTKFDADPKGGVPISVSFVSRKPVSYVGIGQGYEDLKQFSMKDYLQDLVGALP
jgi:fused signal recognition particle receptor